MEKSVIGLVVAIGAAAPLASAHASIVTPDDAARSLQAASMAELLEPVANASAVLAALDAAPKPSPEIGVKGLQVAQWHHHHHHHRYYHHHHHHYYYHHHHHHHHFHDGCWRTPLGWVCP